MAMQKGLLHIIVALLVRFDKHLSKNAKLW
jgi:hypothetical protein